jgi:ATP/maltotriose-dependent transcriptional regulator MalT
MGRKRIYKSDAERGRAWKENNRKRVRDYGKAYYRLHRERCLQKNRKWNRDNYEYALAYSAIRYSRTHQVNSTAQICFETGKLLLKGFSDKEIAKKLRVKLRTVKSHIKRLCIEFKVERKALQRVRLAVKLYEYPIFRGE